MTSPYMLELQCGRLTARGNVCKRVALYYWQLGNAEQKRRSARGQIPHSCVLHLTGEEREQYERIVTAFSQGRHEAMTGRIRAGEAAAVAALDQAG